MLRKGYFNNVSIYINWIPFNPICDFSWRLKDTRDSPKPIALQCPVLLEHATSNNLQYQYNFKHRINNNRKETSHWNNRSKKFPNIIFHKTVQEVSQYTLKTVLNTSRDFLRESKNLPPALLLASVTLQSKGEILQLTLQYFYCRRQITHV